MDFCDHRLILAIFYTFNTMYTRLSFILVDSHNGIYGVFVVKMVIANNIKDCT